MKGRPWLVACLCAWTACSGPDLEPIPEIALDNLGPNLANQLGPQLEALRANPGDVNAAGNAGMLLHAYGQHELAVPFLERAGELDPSQLRWPYYRGISLASLGRGGVPRVYPPRRGVPSRQTALGRCAACRRRDRA